MKDGKHSSARNLEWIQVLDRIPAYVLIAEDQECRSIIGNKATCDLLRIRRGDNLSMSAAPDEIPRTFEVYRNGVLANPEDLPMQRAARGEEVGVGLCELRFTDGGVVWISGGVRTLRDDDGKPCGAIGTFVDVTHVKNSEHELERALRQASAAGQEMSIFLATASHDLRQPVQALLMYLDVLDAVIPERGQLAMQHIRGCMLTLVEQLNDILDLAKLDADPALPLLQSFPIDDVLNRVLTTVAPMAAEKGIGLRHVHCVAEVKSNPALLERIFLNIISNAVKYTDRGRVLVGCRRAGANGLRVMVGDTGRGIPPDKLDCIFQTFYRVEGTPEVGTGLGLSIVDRIARRLGTPVSVVSAIGKGSLFTIDVALADGMADVAPLLCAQD